uniref:Uncharacterized protein n=1 Tax=Cacopsylla melanoneura TaxID=428564 RepID=A0A8D8SD19_9HEMI
MAINLWSLTILSVILLVKVTKAALYTRTNYWSGTRKYSYYGARKYSNWNYTRKYSYDGNRKYSYSWNGTRKYPYSKWNETRKYSYWGSPKYSHWNGSTKYSLSGIQNYNYSRTWKFGTRAITKCAISVTTEPSTLYTSTSDTSRETIALSKTRKYYSRKSGTRTTKPTTTTTPSTTGLTWTTTERSVWPWNTLQYYDTLGPETTTIQLVYWLRNPNGTDPDYYYPNRTEAEHLALVAKRKGRANNTAWCQCGYCDPMTTDEDSVCCREDWYFNRLISMISYEENHCYAQTPMVYMALREPDLEDYRTHFLTNEKRHLVGLYGVDFRNRTQQLWRWLAYRYIIRGANLMTEYDKGRFNETLPACIVKAVRGEFPEPDGIYRETGWSVFQSIRLPG